MASLAAPMIVITAEDAAAEGQSNSEIIADDDNDSAVGDDDDSNTTSPTPSILEDQFENGRRYHTFMEGRYLFPNDEAEQEREELKHAIIKDLVDGILHFAPIGDSSQRILDVGTGKGTWAIDMGDRYPSAEVIGTDLSNIQPSWVPGNVRFVIENSERRWTYQDNWFDMVHGRNLAVGIRNWPKLLRQSFVHLKPGGYVEFQEIHVFPESDDGTLPHDGILQQYFRYIDEACKKLSIDLRVPTRLAGMLRDTGFEDVCEKVFKIPLGEWPETERMRRIGLSQRKNFLDGLFAISSAPYTRVLGWSREELELWLVDVRKAIKDPETHSYDNMYFVYGKKPAVED